MTHLTWTDAPHANTGGACGLSQADHIARGDSLCHLSGARLEAPRTLRDLRLSGVADDLCDACVLAFCEAFTGPPS
jgi:hypothetical protein